jgi:PAS domain-containing protein
VSSSTSEILSRRSASAFLLVAGDGRIVDATDAAACALGFEDKRALTQVAAEQLATRFMPESADGRDAHPAGGGWLDQRPVERILRFRDPEGGWDRWVLLSALPAPRGQALSGRLYLVQDISEFRRREQAARLLEEATVRLGRSLAPERVFEHAAIAAVPFLADECVVLDREPGGHFIPAAWYLLGTSNEQQAQLLVDAVAPLLADLETAGRPLLLRPVASDGQGSERRSILVVPVRQGSETLALLILAMACDTGRCHHPGDHRLAEQLAERVARALADVRLQQSERRRLLAAEERAAFFSSMGFELQAQLPRLLSACDRLESSLSEDERRALVTIREQSRRLHATMDRLFAAAASADRSPRPRWS